MWAAAALAVAAMSSFIGGQRAKKEAKRQALIARQEAEEAALAKEREVQKFASEQELGFLSSGVTLEGSPLMVIKETREEGARDAANIRKFGAARADALRRQGRSAFFQGVTQAVGYGLQGASQLNWAPKAAPPPQTGQVGGFGTPKTGNIA